MMTTKTEYAIRGLIELARQPDQMPVAIREICEKQHLPVKYLEQIFRRLKKAGIVKSIKGACGGYILNHPAGQISLKEIMSAIEDEPARLNCNGKDGYREFCVGSPCDFFAVWETIEDDLDRHLSKVKLSRFLNRKETQ